MTFFWCFGSGMKPKTTDNQKVKDKSGRKCKRDQASSSATPATTLSDSDTRQDSADRCHVFTYQELAAATNNFRPDSLIGRGGFGAVFKGKIESTGQDVAVKMLDEYGVQGDKEFLVEVLMLSLVHHENLVKLIGYCAEGDQRILVYEYMPLGSLEDYIQNSRGGLKSLDLKTRLRIALGAAKGLDHLHNEANVIYRDLKTANILLDHDFNPKLSDFGLAKLGPTDDKTHVSTRVMGTHGYCAPEYALTGKLTMRSDVYSFGVVLLELISGRKAISDSPMGYSTRTLAQWAHKMFVAKKIRKVIDPKLRVQESYVHSTAIKTLKVAFMCLREHADARPLIKDVVDAIIFIAGESKRENNEDNVGSSSTSSREDLKKKLSLSSTRMLSILEEEEEDEEETKRDLERERAVAEAKAWAKNWRAKLRGTDRTMTHEPPLPTP